MSKKEFPDALGLKAARESFHVVSAQLAALGVPVPKDSGGHDAPRSAMLNERTEWRRAINAMSDEYTRLSKSGTADPKVLDNLLTAINASGTFVNDLSNRLDFDEAGSIGNSPANAWRNAHTGEPLRAVGREHVGNMAQALGRQERNEGGFGDFLRGVAGMRTTEGIKAALSVGTDGSGGYAVPSWLFPQFVEALVPVSSLLQAGARVVPLDESAKTFRFARIATVPTAAWRNEAAAVSESDPTFEAVDLTPRSLAFFFRCSRELLQDSPNIDGLLQSVFAQALAKEIDRAGLRGSGSAPEIRGLLNTSGIGAVTNGTNGATLSSIKWTSINAAYQAILDANAPAPTAVIMAPRSLVGFAGMADTTGQPLRRSGLLEPLQFVATSQVPVNLTVGSSTDCTELYVGDFTNLIIGMREGVSVLRAGELYAATGQVGFFCHARVDVGVLRPAAFAKITGVRAG